MPPPLIAIGAATPRHQRPYAGRLSINAGDSGPPMDAAIVFLFDGTCWFAALKARLSLPPLEAQPARKLLANTTAIRNLFIFNFRLKSFPSLCSASPHWKAYW